MSSLSDSSSWIRDETVARPFSTTRDTRGLGTRARLLGRLPGDDIGIRGSKGSSKVAGRLRGDDMSARPTGQGECIEAPPIGDEGPNDRDGTGLEKTSYPL